ncbi:MAG TPA: molybdopterin cofactor-binding domain-containing protein, partial [Candidatus Acidoferrales bacterium]|nr:molybdopterin cofactor-binding domain-containing protein [Candidatus Acidoferrales bacterium]
MTNLGAPITRVDGKLKVTGTATYAAEFSVPNVAYAVIVQSTIPNGRIAGMDASQAERISGVLAVLTPENAPRLPAPQRRISLLQDDQVHYNGQPIAIVVAENLQTAWHAASLVRVQYRAAVAKLDFTAGFPASRPGSHNNIPGDVSWGDVDGGLAQAEIKIDQVYTTPIEHHNPMEPHATIAQWDGNHLTLHDAT